MGLLGRKQWEVHLGDCITHMPDMPPRSVDMSIFSPPFPSLYAYTSEAADIGNSEDLRGEAKLHLSFFYRQLARVVKQGRVIVVHVAQIPRMKRAGEYGLHDFRGMNARIAERAGLIFEGEWVIRKNPQSQAIRTKSRELQFSGLESDRAKSRGTLPDYLLKFRVPGENEVKIDSAGEVSRNDWIEWAETTWMDIIETDTLNTAEAKSEKDTKHICPLQLEPIRRMVLMFTNPGEIVFSPFTGIGSEGFMSLGGKSPKTGKRIVNPRRFYGCELKDEYYLAATKKNLPKAVKQAEEADQLPLLVGAYP
jgi:DNA modification methylase